MLTWLQRLFDGWVTAAAGAPPLVTLAAMVVCLGSWWAWCCCSRAPGGAPRRGRPAETARTTSLTRGRRAAAARAAGARRRGGTRRRCSTASGRSRCGRSSGTGSTTPPGRPRTRWRRRLGSTYPERRARARRLGPALRPRALRAPAGDARAGGGRARPRRRARPMTVVGRGGTAPRALVALGAVVAWRWSRSARAGRAHRRALRPRQPRAVRRAGGGAGARASRASTSTVARGADELAGRAARRRHHGRRHQHRRARPPHGPGPAPPRRPAPIAWCSWSPSRAWSRHSTSGRCPRRCTVGDGRDAACTDPTFEDLRVTVDTALAFPGEGCFPGDVGALVAERDGVTLFGPGQALTNDQVLRGDNAAAALRVLGGSDRLVWYVPERRRPRARRRRQPAARCCPTGSGRACGWSRSRRSGWWCGGRGGSARWPPSPCPSWSRRSRPRAAAAGSTAGRATAPTPRTRCAPPPAGACGSGSASATTRRRCCARWRVVPDRTLDEVTALLGPAPPPPTDRALVALATDLTALDQEVRRP